MTLSETLELLFKKEQEASYLLKSALSLKSYRQWPNLSILRGSNAIYLPAVNSKARIKWGRVLIREIREFFKIADVADGPSETIFFVTLAEMTGLKSAHQSVDIARIKRKFQANLKGLSYIGMIEPGYYNCIYTKPNENRKDVVSWHGHFLVWGSAQRDLTLHLETIKPRFTPIMPGLCAVHQKQIPPDRFGYYLWYIIKSPCKEYSIGKRLEVGTKSGAARFKQNSRAIRPGHRVKLAILMRDMYLDRLAMAGGDGRELLREIKYEAFRDYRAKNGWNDCRP